MIYKIYIYILTKDFFLCCRDDYFSSLSLSLQKSPQKHTKYFFDPGTPCKVVTALFLQNVSFIGLKMAELGPQKWPKPQKGRKKINFYFWFIKFIYTFWLRIFFLCCRDDYFSSLSVSLQKSPQKTLKVLFWPQDPL